MDPLTAWLADLVRSLQATELSHFLKVHSWPLWPMLQTLHLFGMTMLIGAVALFDLRVLGLGKSIAPSALHRLIPWGVAGFMINLCTGTLFFIGNSDQYAFNAAFRLKLAFMALAGANLLFFYATAYREVGGLSSGAEAPLRAKVMTAISLVSWTSVIVCARVLTWFRPVSFG